MGIVSHDVLKFFGRPLKRIVTFRIPFSPCSSSTPPRRMGMLRETCRANLNSCGSRRKEAQIKMNTAAPPNRMSLVTSTPTNKTCRRRRKEAQIIEEGKMQNAEWGKQNSTFNPSLLTSTPTGPRILHSAFCILHSEVPRSVENSAPFSSFKFPPSSSPGPDLRPSTSDLCLSKEGWLFPC
jgi:hypothetical protein